MGFPVAGGSNLVMYDYENGYGYLRRFHLAESVIESQLVQMFRNGQRRMGVLVPYMLGGNPFYCDSFNGRMSTQDASNLKALLILLAKIGFDHATLELDPQMEPPNITEAARNFTFACDVWDQAQGCGIDVGIDLWAEAQDCAPIKWLREGWNDWCERYGDAATVGFSYSVGPNIAAKVKASKAIYANGALPQWYDAHCETPKALTDFRAAMEAEGLSGPTWGGFMIGETRTNSPVMAAAIKANSRGVFWLRQWPIGDNTAPDITQDRLTLDYSNYSAAGL